MKKFIKPAIFITIGLVIAFPLVTFSAALIWRFSQSGDCVERLRALAGMTQRQVLILGCTATAIGGVAALRFLHLLR